MTGGSAASTPPRALFPGPRASLALIGALALAARLWALPGSLESNMDPDGAHLLNVARCFERGQGFSNPAAWPAWMKPERLPMPETFKEPAYPWLIARLTPFTRGAFRAGVLISLLAGLVMPFAVYALARNLRLEPDVATLAGLLTAANPLAIAMSVRVMVDSLFPALLTLAFALAAARPRAWAQVRSLWLDALTGACVGAALITRAQTLVALPAFALLLTRRPLRSAARGALVAAAAGTLVAAPFLLRNLRLFETPLHSDIGAFGVWPYVDPLAFSHGLERPPAVLPFALSHATLVARHMAQSAVRFAIRVLPEHVAGHPAWVLPLAAGLLLALARWRTFLFSFVYLGATLTLVFGVTWDPRYFTSTLPLWALFTALGGVWIARALAGAPVLGPVGGRHLLAGALLVAFGVQAEGARREVARFAPAEIAAARAESAFLKSRLRPDEAAMVVTTSYYSWFADRPMVHLVIADERSFMETVRRLRVRAAVLPTSRLAEFAARYPERRLPRALELDHANGALDVTVFTVREAPATSP